jgi:hypothetical protein
MLHICARMHTYKWYTFAHACTRTNGTHLRTHAYVQMVHICARMHTLMYARIHWWWWFDGIVAKVGLEQHLIMRTNALDHMNIQRVNVHAHTQTLIVNVHAYTQTLIIAWWRSGQRGTRKFVYASKRVGPYEHTNGKRLRMNVYVHRQESMA